MGSGKGGLEVRVYGSSGVLPKQMDRLLVSPWRSRCCGLRVLQIDSKTRKAWSMLAKVLPAATSILATF